MHKQRPIAVGKGPVNPPADSWWTKANREQFTRLVQREHADRMRGSRYGYGANVVGASMEDNREFRRSTKAALQNVGGNIMDEYGSTSSRMAYGFSLLSAS